MYSAQTQYSVHEFDQAVEDCLLEVWDWDESVFRSAQRTQIRMGLLQGGMGVRSMYEVANIAFVSSWALVLP